MAFFRLQTLSMIDFTRIFQLKGLTPKNKGHTNFYKCCDLTKKVYLKAYVKRTKKGETHHLIEAILDYSTFNPSSVKVGANSISHHFGTFPRSLHRQVIDISNTANCLQQMGCYKLIFLQNCSMKVLGFALNIAVPLVDIYGMERQRVSLHFQFNYFIPFWE